MSVALERINNPLSPVWTSSYSLVHNETLDACVRLCFEKNREWFRLPHPVSIPVHRVVNEIRPPEGARNARSYKQRFYPCGTLDHPKYGLTFLIHSPTSSKTLSGEEPLCAGSYKTMRPGGAVWLVDRQGKILTTCCKKVISGKNKKSLHSDQAILDTEREVTLLQRLQGKRGIAELLGSYTYLSRKQRRRVVLVMPQYQLWSASAEHPRQIQRDLLAGLAVIHADGIVHRDLKPANVFLEGCRALIGDFGLAVDLKESNNRYTSWAGSRDYLAPEYRIAFEKRDLFDQYHLLFGQGPDKRSEEMKGIELKLYPRHFRLLQQWLQQPKESVVNQLVEEMQAALAPAIDVWTLGLIFYQMLLCERPNDLPLMPAIVASSRLLDPSKDSALFPEPSDQNTFAHLVWKMLRADPAQRITAQAALEQLTAIMQREGTQPAENPPESVSSLFPVQHRGRAAVAAGGSCCAIS